MPRLTAILISHDEEKDLPRALASLEGIADEIVVVDSGSTDRSVEIATQHGARLFTKAFIDFAEQKNYAAAQAASAWVLSLDCDEALSPELRESLLEWKQGEPEHVGYEVTRITQFLGGWIWHSGWYPDRLVRLYLRDRGRFSGKVHENVRLDGPPGRLAGHLYHFTAGSIPEQAAKIDVYTNIAAQELFHGGHKSWRAQMLLLPPWTLFHCLVVRLGFLDGYRGLIIARLAARSVFLKYRKLGALQSGGSHGERHGAAASSGSGNPLRVSREDTSERPQHPSDQ